MRDDIKSLPLPKSAKKYARLTSKDLGSDWSKKVGMYMSMAADLTNQDKDGFENKDGFGEVEHEFNESAETVVRLLLDEGPDYSHAHCHALTAAMQRRNPRGEPFGLFDVRYADEIVHSAFRLPDTETLVDNFGRHADRSEWEKVKRNFDGSENLEWRPITDAKLRALVVGGRRSVRSAGSVAKRILRNESRAAYRYETKVRHIGHRNG